MSWVSTSARNLLPRSRNQVDFAIALREWRYLGNYEDLECPSADCELCEHPEIRYQFEITNSDTGHSLLVGSECIKKFQIGAVDEDGKTLDAKSSAAKIDKDRRRLVVEAKRKRVVVALVALSRVDDDFNILSFLDYFHSRNVFTPKQLLTLIWRFDKHRIKYNPVDFTTALRRSREKRQLYQLERWQILRLWPCLSELQRRRFVKNAYDPHAPRQ